MTDGRLSTPSAQIVELEYDSPPSSVGISFRWLICGLLFLATSINYMDRQVVSILAPVLQSQFRWSEQDYAHLVFAFQLAYMVGLLSVGWFIDRCGLKVGYAVAIFVWSAAACATAFAASFAGFIAVRLLLGLGEAGNFPAATKTVGEWFARRERSLATWLMETGKTVHFARKFSLGLCALCVTPIAFVGLMHSIWPAIFIVGFAMAAMQGWSANSYCITTDLYPKRAIASMVGLATAAGSVGSMIFAEFAGWYLAHSHGSYILLFALAGCGFPLAFLALHLFIPRWEPVHLEIEPRAHRR